MGPHTGRSQHGPKGLTVLAAMMLGLAAGAGTAVSTRGVTEDLLKSLTYADNIPGFRSVSMRPDGPWIILKDHDVSGVARRGSIMSLWESGDGFTDLRIGVDVCPDSTIARNLAAAGSSVVFTRDEPGSRIGDASWTHVSLGYGGLRFVLGRVVVRLMVYPIGRRPPGASEATVVSPMDHFVEDVVRTLARGLEWVIRQHPDMMASTDGSGSRIVIASGKPVSAPALEFGNVAWVSLDTFRQGGARVVWDAKSGKATVSYGNRSVELTALRRQARANGRDLDLGAGVMVDRFGPVVPLRKVAEALGMKVRATKTTIWLG